MVSDDEMSEDEDEILVYVEFEGLVDVNVFSEEQLQLDMIGIDTEHPIMQINGKVIQNYPTRRTNQTIYYSFTYDSNDFSFTKVLTKMLTVHICFS